MVTLTEYPLSGLTVVGGTFEEDHVAGFFVHPLSLEDIPEFVLRDTKSRLTWEKPNLRELILNSFRAQDPLAIGMIDIIAAGKKCSGPVMLIPFFPSDYEKARVDGELRKRISDKIIQAARISKSMGVKYLGLGALNSGDPRIVALLKKEGILPFTTGNTMTICAVIDGVLVACRKFNLDPRKLTVTIVGATGANGKVVSQMIAGKFRCTNLVARDEEKLKKLAGEIPDSNFSPVADLNAILPASDVVIFLTSAPCWQDLNIDPKSFKPKSLLFDYSRPNNLDPNLKEARKDLFICMGTVYQIPGKILYCADILRMGGEQLVYPCLLETIIWGLEDEQDIRGVTDINPSKVIGIGEKAASYGFRMVYQLPGSTCFPDDLPEVAKSFIAR